MQLRFTPHLIWLLNQITPIHGLEDDALLLTAYPLDRKYTVKSWAWWGPGVIWIGPRHTNYPDGSICSFEPDDVTWWRGKPLTALFDLHVLWIVRHLFLRRFRRWPGRQVLHTAYERLMEHCAGELCGCDSGRKYEDCCREKDRKLDSIEMLASFIRRLRFGSSERKPPIPVSEFVYGSRRIPPSLQEMISAINPARLDGSFQKGSS